MMDLPDLPMNTFDLGSNSTKPSMSHVFIDKGRNYLNEFNLYLLHFNRIPNFTYEIKIDCRKANEWFVDTYKDEIRDWYFDKRYYGDSKRAEFDDLFYFLCEDLLVTFDINCSIVRFLFRKTDLNTVNSVIEGIRAYRKGSGKQKPEVFVLIYSNRSFELKTLALAKPKLSIADNYNDDFPEIHQTILSHLKKKKGRGVILLHGKPGTGKTSYIRYLAASIKKSIFFLPPNMAGALTNPELISILIDNPNSVFVIEDAENVIMDREQDGNSQVSNLLNISDGLLSDALNINIICSFNTDLSKVDDALMRKGRLIAKYEFRELEIEKAQALSNKLGFSSIIREPMSLTDIYNQQERSFQAKKPNNSIGFRTMCIN